MKAQTAGPSPWAQRLGYGGLVPFVGLAAAVWLAPPGDWPLASMALLAYGATIASFLGAIHWGGLVMRDGPLQPAVSIKIRPEWADRGDRLALKDTWTKGGRAREILIRNTGQRQVLDEAKALAGRGSLIPAERNYVEQLRRFEYQCAAAGAHRMHGHRHQYAQTRYRRTDWLAAAGGGRAAIEGPHALAARGRPRSAAHDQRRAGVCA